METKAFGHQILHQFDAELEHLHSRVLAMGAQLEEQVLNALSALMESDPRLGESTT